MFAFAAVVVVLAVTKGLRHVAGERPFPVRDYYEWSEAALEGHKVYRRLGCNSCHRAMGVGEIGVAPVLDGEGTRRSLEWLQAYFDDPASIVPGTAHDGSLGPDLGALAASERRLLSAFLFALKANEGSPNYPVPPLAGAQDGNDTKP